MRNSQREIDLISSENNLMSKLKNREKFYEVVINKFCED